MTLKSIASKAPVAKAQVLPVASVLPVFIGYDSREDLAFKVCNHSLTRRSTIPVSVVKLDHLKLREAKLFKREWHTQANGQMFDLLDHKPFSTEFSHTRFLVPEIARRSGMKGWALFVDSDYLFLDDVTKLFQRVEDQGDKAVCVVKFALPIVEDTKKMDNKVQSYYPKKLWSSCVMWNLDHPSNRLLSHDDVNSWSGAYMHNFGWLEENEIGTLPFFWNFIPGISEELPFAEPAAIHYSLGGPWLPKYRDCLYSKQWHQECDHMELTGIIAKMGERFL